MNGMSTHMIQASLQVPEDAAKAPLSEQLRHANSEIKKAMHKLHKVQNSD